MIQCKNWPRRAPIDLFVFYIIIKYRLYFNYCMDIFEITHLLKKNPPRSYWEIQDFIKRTSKELALNLVDNKYELGYEIITNELIDQLSDRIIRWLATKDTLTVMEVGAWNGRLAFNLQQKLNTKAPGKIHVVAIDNNKEFWAEKFFSIDNTTFEKSVDRYKPDIIVCSWMPQHVTPTLVDQWSHLFELEDYARYKKQALDNIKNPAYREQTSARRTYPNLLEYILIWPIHSCGDGSLSYWVKKLPPKVYDPSSMQRRANTEDIEREEKPVFHVDGFLREELIDVLNLNIFDFLVWKKFTQSSSTTHSFVNINFLDPKELQRLNSLHDKLMYDQKHRFANK